MLWWGIFQERENYLQKQKKRKKKMQQIGNVEVTATSIFSSIKIHEKIKKPIVQQAFCLTGENGKNLGLYIHIPL